MTNNNHCCNNLDYFKDACSLSGFNKLISPGRGTVAYHPKKQEPFKIYLTTKKNYNHSYLVLSVDKGSASITYHQSELAEQVLCHKESEYIGLDPEPNLNYWFSFDAATGKVYYGKGEHRQSTAILSFKLTGVRAWMNTLAYYSVSPDPAEDSKLAAFKDAAIEVSPILVGTDAPTLDCSLREVGIEYDDLIPDSKKYYDNIIKSNFALDTEDFPSFFDAVEESLQDPNGWCHKKLESKMAIFETSDTRKSYLRISMGLKGDDSRIPYVIEIWPPGHYSPIHNHGDTNSIIRCLYGGVDVEVYAFLSTYHQEPNEVVHVKKGDVSWITPYFNQIHVLHNTNPKQSCMTLQCYLFYAGQKHKPFGFITEENKVHTLTPKSDIDFVSFKELLKKEWSARHHL